MPTQERIDRGLAIIGPYRTVWTNRLFETPEQAIDHLKNFWKGTGKLDLSKWSVAPATQTISIDYVVMEADATPLKPSSND